MLSSSIPIVIGRNSSNELLVVELTELPHLFVSYAEEEQLYRFYESLSHKASETNPVQWALAVSPSGFDHFKQTETNFHFLTNDPENSNIESKFTFWKKIAKELKKRKKSRQKLKKLFEINTPILIVVLEDVLDMVITNKKYTGYYFLQLMAEGPGLGVHCIASSGRAYRNLLSQLLNLHPKVKQQLQKQLPNVELSIQSAEIVITPEDFYFYKRKNDKIHERYFNDGNPIIG